MSYFDVIERAVRKTMIVATCIKCREPYKQRYCNNRLCLNCKISSREETNKKNSKRLSLMRKSVMVTCRYCNKPISGYNGKHYCSSSCRTMYYNIPKKIIWAENEILVLQEKLKKWRSIESSK